MMKNMSVLVGFMLVAVVASGQDYKKGDSVVLVNSGLSPGDCYKAILRKLAIDGVAVELSDNEVRTIETKWVSGRGDLRLRYFVFVDSSGDGSVVRLRGDYDTGLGESRIEYRGMKGSPSLRAWEALVALGEAVTGSTL